MATTGLTCGDVRQIERARQAAVLLQEGCSAHEVIAGEGRRRLFAEDGPLKNLELVNSYSTSSGTIIANYRPRG
ncbi:hypothetical protein ACOQFL_09550 [Actinopolyspora sp. H202]|uniref:hypothetical protein n=1 Tax=Actinopolyspora sp. H202 TaxID=1500456 RepID=UPI003EE80FCD